jgi:ABC-type dipeptide/oligopeptide/nickel transport system permease component
VLRSIGWIVLSIWLAGTLVFWALRVLPGDALRAQYAEDTDSSIVARKQAALGLDQPLLVQYGLYWVNVLRGDWGVSLYSGRSVLELLGERLPNTVLLAMSALGIAIIGGFGLGLLAGGEYYSAQIARGFIHLALSVPIYWTSTLVVFVVGVRLGGIQGNLWLPALVLGAHTAAGIARPLYTEIQLVRRTDYIRTAHSKGLGPRYILIQHILRVALLPVIPLIALQSSFLFSGAILTESIFQRAGIGLLLLDAVLGRDYPVVQGVVLLITIVYLGLQGTADLLIRWFDPRLRW